MVIAIFRNKYTMKRKQLSIIIYFFDTMTQILYIYRIYTTCKFTGFVYRDHVLNFLFFCDTDISERNKGANLIVNETKERIL